MQAFSPAQLEDIGLSAADYVAPAAAKPGMIAWMRERLAFARTAEELSRLSPHQLDDIGLTSADVDRVRRHASFF